MQARRCAVLVIEPRERLDFDLARLTQGGSGIEMLLDSFALAAHLDEEQTLDDDEVRILGKLSPENWVDFDALAAEHPQEVLQSLVSKDRSAE